MNLSEHCLSPRLLISLMERSQSERIKPDTDGKKEGKGGGELTRQDSVSRLFEDVNAINSLSAVHTPSEIPSHSETTYFNTLHKSSRTKAYLHHLVVTVSAVYSFKSP